MKISELADASGESVSTIKYYIREGLLPAGQSSARTQASYDEEHVRRLGLIRTLQVELGLSVDKIREILEQAAQGGEAMLAAGLKGARESRHGQKKKQDKSSPELAKAWLLITQMAKELDWEMHPDDMMAEDVAEALSTILRVMPDSGVDKSLVEYARAMKGIADEEIPDSFDPAAHPWEALRYAVLGTYLFEPLILSLRRMAHGQRTAEVMRPKKSGTKNKR